MHRAVLLLLLAACDASTDTDAVDTDAADSDAACTALRDGPWSASGTCFGMRMDATLAFDAATCTFTLADWDMEMDTPNPESGSVSADVVTLDGPDWSDCTGTASGPGRITGTCGDGCAYELAFRR